MAYTHEVIIRERDVADRDDIHAALAAGLAFPSYYGASLNALDDCLGDVSAPALVRVVRERGEGLLCGDYLDKVCVCLMRAARENPALDVEVSFGEPAASWREAYPAGLDEEAGLD